MKKKKHRIDLRGTIPLFFRKYYFVILIGRDTRETTQAIEADRRAGVRRVGFIMSLVFISIPLLIFIFLLLYFLKSALGINIFPHRHLGDFTDPILSFFDTILEKIAASISN